MDIEYGVSKVLKSLLRYEILISQSSPTTWKEAFLTLGWRSGLQSPKRPEQLNSMRIRGDLRVVAPSIAQRKWTAAIWGLTYRDREVTFVRIRIGVTPYYNFYPSGFILGVFILLLGSWENGNTVERWFVRYESLNDWGTEVSWCSYDDDRRRHGAFNIDDNVGMRWAVRDCYVYEVMGWNVQVQPAIYIYIYIPPEACCGTWRLANRGQMTRRLNYIQPPCKASPIKLAPACSTPGILCWLMTARIDICAVFFHDYYSPLDSSPKTRT